MPRFSANLGFLWSDLPLLERIDAAGRAGFRAVEFHWPYDVPAAAVKAACTRNDVAVLGLNTIPGDMARGEFGLAALPGREADFQAAMDQSIAYCRDIGGTAVHAMAGVVPPERREAAEAVLRRNLAEAADKAAEAGLTLLLEPINPRDKADYAYSTVGAAAAIIAELRRPNMRLMFDCYHAGIAEGDLIMKLRAHLPIIGHVQIAAVPSRAEPDEGEIAYPAIFAELDRLGYAGWVGCEYRPRAATDAGLSWLQALGVRL